MSESEDDFMSDRFLVESARPSLPEGYTARRSAHQLRSRRAGQAKQLPSLKQRETEQRRAGLATSLFANKAGEPEGSGGGRAIEMMIKMGWKVGEGLGRKRSPSPPGDTAKRARTRLGDAVAGKEEQEEEGEPSRGGIGSSSRPQAQPRTEPIRISMWAGRKGLSARSPSPPPLPNVAGRNPDALDPRKMARLEGETEGFRERQRREFAEREVERKGGKAREILLGLDRERGIKVGWCMLLGSPLGQLSFLAYHLHGTDAEHFLSSSTPCTSSPPTPSAPSPVASSSSSTPLKHSPRAPPPRACRAPSRMWATRGKRTSPPPGSCGSRCAGIC